MPAPITVRYPSAADLAGHLQEHASHGALLLPLPSPPEALEQFQQLDLTLQVPGDERQVQAEVLQVIPGLGLAVKLADPVVVAELTGGAQPSPAPSPPLVGDDSQDPPAAAAPEEQAPPTRPRGPSIPRGMGPASWPMEKLMADWHTLTLPQKVHVAKHGKAAARRMIIKQQDKKLHQFLLQNSGISIDEVAAMVSMSGLDPAIIQRIAASPEWTRHAPVARALVCHPKTSMAQVSKLLGLLPDNELRRLTRTGRVRNAVKRLIINRLEQGRRQR